MNQINLNEEMFDRETGKIRKDIDIFKNVVNYYHVKLIDDKLPEGYVYIGRANPNKGLKELGQSKFHNRNKVLQSNDKKERIKNRIDSVLQFKKDFWNLLMEEEITKEELLSLDGKKKVCFCGENLCHGHMIELYIYYVKNNEMEFDRKLKEYKERKMIKEQENNSFSSILRKRSLR